MTMLLEKTYLSASSTASRYRDTTENGGDRRRVEFYQSGGTSSNRPMILLIDRTPIYAKAHRSESESFEASYNQWLDDTAFDSLPDRMRRHQSYSDIINLGSSAVPLIAGKLRAHPSFIFLALEDILKTDPVPDSAHGDLRATVSAWLKWLPK